MFCWAVERCRRSFGVGREEDQGPSSEELEMDSDDIIKTTLTERSVK